MACASCENSAMPTCRRTWSHSLSWGEKVTSCVPECWQETALQVDYAQALTQALLAGMLPLGVAKELTGLLHDMVWLLAEFVKEPYIANH